jgi:hypothetical protein
MSRSPADEPYCNSGKMLMQETDAIKHIYSQEANSRSPAEDIHGH